MKIDKINEFRIYDTYIDKGNIIRFKNIELIIKKEIYDKLIERGLEIDQKSVFIYSPERFDSYINSSNGWDSFFYFEFLSENRTEFMNKSLGYDDGGNGTFPYVDNVDDAIKLCNDAIKKILNT